jgi:hypothetical protein
MIKPKRRRGLAREGQGPKPKSKEVMGKVGPVVPLARLRPERNSTRTNDRLRDMGDFTVLFGVAFLGKLRAGGRGRAYRDPIIEAMVLCSVLYHLPLRQTEGLMRAIFRTAGLDPELVPDYSTLCRRRVGLRPNFVPKLSATRGVVLIIDSTGAHLDQRQGWADDKPGADPRRGKYLKVHLGIDALTGQILAFSVTKSYGPGSGDPSVAPRLIEEAYEVVQASDAHLNGGLGDGAYDSGELYKEMRKYGGVWYAPPPDNAQRGRHPDRDRHIDGTKKFGEVSKGVWVTTRGLSLRPLMELSNVPWASVVGPRA